jgi:predicted phage terminase large subunit-like protein
VEGDCNFFANEVLVHNCLLIDDPVKNREDADSETMREAAWEWYTSTARTRLHPGAAVVVCQTRWHEDDLTGRLLKAAKQGGEQWEVLRLPALAEEGDPLGREVGAALWPEWFDAAALETIRKTVGARNWAALYQQRPYNDEGALFKRSWFRTVNDKPPGLRWVRYWDLAVSTKASGDYTVGARCAFGPDGTLYIGDIARGRWEWPEALAIVSGMARVDGPGTAIGIEGIGVQRGFRQTLLRDPSLRGFALLDVPVLKDKLLRAAPWQARAEAGKVALVLGPWNAAFLDEACAFPLGEHDDQCDAVSGAVQMLATATRGVQTLDLRIT